MVEDVVGVIFSTNIAATKKKVNLLRAMLPAVNFTISATVVFF